MEHTFYNGNLREHVTLTLTCNQTFCGRAVTMRFNDYGLSRLGFKQSTLSILGELL